MNNFSITPDLKTRHVQKFFTLGRLKKGIITVHVAEKLIFPVEPCYKLWLNFETERGVVSVESFINMN